MILIMITYDILRFPYFPYNITFIISTTLLRTLRLPNNYDIVKEYFLKNLLSLEDLT